MLTGVEKLLKQHRKYNWSYERLKCKAIWKCLALNGLCVCVYLYAPTHNTCICYIGAGHEMEWMGTLQNIMSVPPHIL